MIVYIDVLFLINVLANGICLYISGKVMNASIKPIPLVLSSVIGGIFGVLWEIFSLNSGVLTVAVSIIMFLVCFGFVSFLFMFKGVILMYMVGMLLGGIMTFFQRIIIKYRIYPIFKNGTGWVIFMVAFFSVFFLMKLSARLLSIHSSKKNVECFVSDGEREIKLSLISDSGNLLKDPFNGRAVIILKAECLDKILGEDGVHRRALKLLYGDNRVGISDYNESEKFYYVVAKGLSGQLLLPVIPSLKAYSSKKGKRHCELFAVIASDNGLIEDMSDIDGIMPMSLSEV